MTGASDLGGKISQNSKPNPSRVMSATDTHTHNHKTLPLLRAALLLLCTCCGQLGRGGTVEALAFDPVNCNGRLLGASICILSFSQSLKGRLSGASATVGTGRVHRMSLPEASVRSAFKSDDEYDPVSIVPPRTVLAWWGVSSNDSKIEQNVQWFLDRRHAVTTASPTTHHLGDNCTLLERDWSGSSYDSGKLYTKLRSQGVRVVPIICELALKTRLSLVSRSVISFAALSLASAVLVR